MISRAEPGSSPAGRLLRLSWLVWVMALTAGGAPPRYDHVVVVIEENHTAEQIIGDVINAPYMNALGRSGVILNSMFGIEHPSQPNYLQLFSGSNQGVQNDSLPVNFSKVPTATYPFTTPNLAAGLLAAGVGFAGFSEDLEAAGDADWADYDPRTATRPVVWYRRRHNPWANWIAKVSPIPTNQLPAGVNRAFSQFPTDFNELPEVSIVVPNLLNDMHDGSRKQADEWLRTRLDAYARWARTNNSLLIVTWDEDDFNEDNRIPTLLYGAGLRDGVSVDGTWTLHNLLRTLEDMYSVPTHAGFSALVRPMVGPFMVDPLVKVATFRQGLDSYAGARDTWISQEAPDESHPVDPLVVLDLDSNTTVTGNQQTQGLIRFDSLFGPGPGQVPSNATLHSAKLLLYTPKNGTNTAYDSNDSFRVLRMISDWTDGVTWNGLAGGINADGVEAALSATFSVVPEVDGAPAICDVTADVELFRTGTPNRGWGIRAATSATGDGWGFFSSDNTNSPSLRPTLEIVYSVPTTTYADWVAAWKLAPGQDDVAKDTDLDGANNLTEFAFNLNPRRFDANPLTASGVGGTPSVRLFSEGGVNMWEVQFIRRSADSGPGVDYLPEISRDLTAWSPLAASDVESIRPGWERVSIRQPIQPGDSRTFVRVRVVPQS